MQQGKRRGPFDLVVSALTLHNFVRSDQRRVLNRVHEVLRVGGGLIQADLFTFSDRRLAAAAHRADLQYIKEAHCREIAKTRTPRAASRLRKAMAWWTHHYEHENHLVPLENAGRRAGQIQVMQTIGFSDVAVVCRRGQTVVIWARKRSG